MSNENSRLKNVKIFREKKGWTQEKLAQQAGISYQTLIKIEHGGIKNPRMETLIKIAKSLEVPLDKLIEYEK
jgi:transcriptional regulator with XRE-family HTH domain